MVEAVLQKDRIDIMNAERESLLKECQQLRSRVAVLETINKEYRTRYDQLQDTVTGLRTRMEELEQGSDSAAVIADLEGLKKENAVLQQTVKETQERYDELNTRYASEKKRAEEKEILISKGLLKLKNMFAEQVAKVKSLEKELALIEARCSGLEAALAKMKTGH